MTSLSHPTFTKNIGRIVEGWVAFTWPERNQRPATGRRRFATVGDAIVEVLSTTATDVRFVDVHREVERLLGSQVSRSSVKNYLAAGGDTRRGIAIERVARGRYRLTPS
jgi:hypothetical protein